MFHHLYYLRSMKNETGRRVLLVGATGLTGSYLLNYLLNDSRINEVIVLARKERMQTHTKLKWRVVNLLEPSTWQSYLENIQDVYCCIGTTAKKSPNNKVYESIDLGIPVALAEACQNNGVEAFAVISAMAADANSRLFYNKLKGRMEDKVKLFKIPRIYIFRPAIILGDRKEFRLGERIAAFITKLFSFLIPANYKSVKAEKIAEVMHHFVSNRTDKGLYIISSKDIYEF